MMDKKRSKRSLNELEQAKSCSTQSKSYYQANQQNVKHNV